ncbi:MarR family transcriptional regulator [Paucibacter sp. B2R-40]|uniref:MarR family winged helix-turn-helix transcriptional regulator n=1 Tax=Paucibacter sp. B2R-40 TaxID=2893554 RepID=UPI0021E4D526|nr:MarR family transcriptional regulator [Paucibacter sp. B2R-40]MCV2356417.1 MarR family transcriptional regulator [Paucibacter sp. B2R-40]
MDASPLQDLAAVPPDFDLESRATADDHQALRLWLRLLACTTRVEGVIRNRLRQDFATTLPRFDLLAQLERNPDGLPMRELSKRLMVTGGNITGITDQLESEGLVVREAHASDRRSFTVKLTPLGKRQFKRMAATHEQWVVELLAGWSVEEKSQVYGLLAGLKSHLTDLGAADAATANKGKKK